MSRARNFGVPRRPALIRNTAPLYQPPAPPVAAWIANRRADWRTVKMIARQVAHSLSWKGWAALGLFLAVAAIAGKVAG